MPRLDRRVRFRSRAVSSGELDRFIRRILLMGAIVGSLLILATVGLAVSEDVGVWYAFRWALDTAATFGQVLQVALVLVGIGTLFYAVAAVTEFFGAGHLGELLAARRRQKMIDSLSGHHIICGFGRVGRQVARDLFAADARYVVVDSNTESRHIADAHGMQFLEGD